MFLVWYDLGLLPLVLGEEPTGCTNRWEHSWSRGLGVCQKAVPLVCMHAVFLQTLLTLLRVLPPGMFDGIVVLFIAFG